ncbi:hypothetical protein N0V93_000004 [Gnomoniopsis smithogilvyi]|uniref:Uncharacterized protein n=1 Tax=Gnomoniopsis smithogilvyi TaxID=1191159 RepID=A0A9W8Z132_9PEZI|nr:hypothetical protein N0V93_000004 [Gnomoniopsis smithogilvyi]
MFVKSQVLVLSPEHVTNDNPAVIVPSKRSKPSATSYAQLNSLSCSLQHCLALVGVSKGSKVALVLPNSLEFVVAFLAVVRQRAVAALVNPQLKQDEYRQALNSIKPDLIIVSAHPEDTEHVGGVTHPVVRVAAELGLMTLLCQIKHDDAYLESCGPDAEGKLAAPASSRRPVRVFSPEEANAEDDVLLLLTSGTTGPPKAVMLSHTNLFVAMRIIVSSHSLSSIDYCLIITPLFHIIGVGGSLLTTLFTGGCVVIPTSLSGSLWKTCEEFKVTWFHAVPTLYRLILAFPFPAGKVPPTLRFLRSGGSDMAPDLYTKLQELGLPILEVYGMTETAPAIFCNLLNPGRGKERKLGHYPISEAVDVMIQAPLPVSDKETNAGPDSGPMSGPEDGPGRSSSIPDDPILRLTKMPGVAGEVCVRGKSVMAGYVDNPEANTMAFLSNGFFRTGDLGILHSDGYLQLVGRLKEIINKGGEKVSPSEIEHLSLSHEAVREAACFRIVDEMYGEDIGLAVVLDAQKECKAATLKKHIRQQAALFKVPKVIVFTDSITTNKTGKPLRSFLAEEYAKGKFEPAGA